MLEVMYCAYRLETREKDGARKGSAAKGEERPSLDAVAIAVESNRPIRKYIVTVIDSGEREVTLDPRVDADSVSPTSALEETKYACSTPDMLSTSGKTEKPKCPP
ncbi:hypothetical protein ARMGADRAFT_1074971 [Armillaria gallica]|uniref:Uncharacterized protein n=1 Tax=Armillaria gallica TaxID=47427 RepID=A0A2H3DSA7_ARMGA|nr:hypothetical protein ARMGADRAFT_1074971 [Armillaria gallica]